MIEFTRKDLNQRRDVDLFYDLSDDDIDYLVACQVKAEKYDKILMDYWDNITTAS